MISLIQYDAGETIIKENDMGDAVYILESGRARVTKQLNDQQVLLGFIEAGEPFGEMSMIDDKPRSATVTAMEETRVREIHRNDFLENLQTDPDATIAILRVLFERLRDAHMKILQMEHPSEVAPQPEFEFVQKEAVVDEGTVYMEGLTPTASQSLPENPYRIDKFPFLIGRKSRDPFSYNDLRIPDSVPLQISRHHIELIKQDGRIGVSDRGSHLGSIVDGRLLGGREGAPGPLLFTGSEGILILGNHNSPFRYKIKIHQ
jgi:CRP/FNR family transcriptional regulator, cyclic AMP receptor protein